MKRAKQLTVALPNRPGMLAELCGCLAEAGVNIRAISVADATEACLVRLVADNPSAAKKALAEKGMTACETSVRLVELPDKVGALAEMATRLARRKVNINYVYGSAATGRGKSILIVEARSTR